MATLELAHLIEAGAHFGHLTRRWNPKMKPFIFMEKNGIHIIDLKKSLGLLNQAYQEMIEAVSQGSTILFVGTKKQAKGVIESEAKRCGMNWVSERWLGGMLTNFSTIRKSVKRLQNIEKQETDGTFDKITKKERLFLTRERDKLKKILEGVETMSRLPGVVFVVDIKKEDIAVKEARRLNIPVFAMVDTNCDPDPIDHVIPANDDAVKTIELIVKHMADAVIEGQAKFKERKAEEVAERERVKKEHHEETEQSEEKKISKKHLKRKDKKEEDISEEKKDSDQKEPSSEN
ncbi:MAG: 30S ribosomal protein S2 [Ignavibacteriaceae bacterium]|jgi:small subunit ribosomal protein S2|nr:30S ribosomal protein S2 [Ignavibacteriaceae bacterium]MCW9065952.1 30S ribosomal protein S2 [Ignavibacteriaceae bacterium]